MLRRFPHLPLLSLAVGLAVAACTGSPAGRAEAGPGAATLALVPCQLSLPGGALRVPAECGTLEVPEDRHHPEARTLSLSVAVLPAVRRQPEPDPLFLLAGGPGQAATEAFLPLLGALRGIRQERDLVLVDQRGTGGSNPLDCDFGPEAELEILSDDDQEKRLRACLESWEADLRFYHTAAAAADLDAVREALGYRSINLYGVSYGSRAALTYLREFPDRVRALVLDGVVPQDLVLGADWAGDAQRALDLIFERCRRDSACAAAFPHLEETFRGLLDSLEGEPRTVHLLHPLNGAAMSLELDRELAAVLVQRLSYSPETVALLPLLIHQAGREGSLEALAAQALTTGASFGAMSVGMSLSVLCTEDEPFLGAAQADAAGSGPYLRDYQPRLLRRFCAFWPRGEAPAGVKAATASAVPALLLSGEADPVTPPAYGERVARRLSNGRHLVAPGLGHNVLPRGCIPELVEEFLESGSAAGLDAGCVNEIEPAPFFLSPAGPAP